MYRMSTELQIQCVKPNEKEKNRISTEKTMCVWCGAECWIRSDTYLRNLNVMKRIDLNERTNKWSAMQREQCHRPRIVLNSQFPIGQNKKIKPLYLHVSNSHSLPCQFKLFSKPFDEPKTERHAPKFLSNNTPTHTHAHMNRTDKRSSKENTLTK